MMPSFSEMNGSRPPAGQMRHVAIPSLLHLRLLLMPMGEPPSDRAVKAHAALHQVIGGLAVVQNPALLSALGELCECLVDRAVEIQRQEDAKS